MPNSPKSRVNEIAKKYAKLFEKYIKKVHTGEKGRKNPVYGFTDHTGALHPVQDRTELPDKILAYIKSQEDGKLEESIDESYTPEYEYINGKRRKTENVIEESDSPKSDRPKSDYTKKYAHSKISLDKKQTLLEKKVPFKRMEDPLQASSSTQRPTEASSSTQRPKEEEVEPMEVDPRVEYNFKKKQPSELPPIVAQQETQPEVVVKAEHTFPANVNPQPVEQLPANHLAPENWNTAENATTNIVSSRPEVHSQNIERVKVEELTNPEQDLWQQLFDNNQAIINNIDPQFHENIKNLASTVSNMNLSNQQANQFFANSLKELQASIREGNNNVMEATNQIVSDLRQVQEQTEVQNQQISGIAEQTQANTEQIQQTSKQVEQTAEKVEQVQEFFSTMTEARAANYRAKRDGDIEQKLKMFDKEPSKSDEPSEYLAVLKGIRDILSRPSGYHETEDITVPSIFPVPSNLRRNKNRPPKEITTQFFAFPTGQKRYTVPRGTSGSFE